MSRIENGAQGQGFIMAPLKMRKILPVELINDTNKKVFNFDP